MTEMVSELDRDTVTGKKTKVKVTATPLGAAPWVTFAMRADYLNQGGQQDGDELVFDPGAGPFTLTFDLADDTDLDLAFYPQFSDAIWVAVGSDCPTEPGDANGAITPVSVADKKLVVTNQNAVGQNLTFMLRFTGNASAGGHPPYVYDPGIVNGGGRVEEEDDAGDDQDNDRGGERGERGD